MINPSSVNYITLIMSLHNYRLRVSRDQKTAPLQGYHDRAMA